MIHTSFIIHNISNWTEQKTLFLFFRKIRGFFIWTLYLCVSCATVNNLFATKCNSYLFVYDLIFSIFGSSGPQK